MTLRGLSGETTCDRGGLLGVSGLTLTRARLYHSIRTAHLERAHVLAPAAIIYQRRRYDFDPQLTDGLELVQAGPVRAALIIARSPVSTLEINEPLMLDALPATVLTLVSTRLLALLGKPRVTVVCYAIANRNPFATRASLKWKTRTRRRLERIVSALVWCRLDRVVFGTDASRELYEQLQPARRDSNLNTITALPSVCDCPRTSPKTRFSVVFLGAMDQRKGMMQLLAAWPGVVREIPAATLAVIGKGPLEPQAYAAAHHDQSIEVIVDPARPEIHRQLRRAQVVVLPSQPSPSWKEQVGLPIVEGLAHGCSIVTTSESGISDWLAARDHSVIDPNSGHTELTTAIIHQLEAQTPAPNVERSLPPVDGRLAADEWLFRAPNDS